MRVVLVRHGETLGESSIRLNGVTDVGLCPIGIRQMEQVRDALADEVVGEVLASPLQRSRDGAARVRPGAEVRVVPGFREVDFGRWETWTWDEVAARDPEGLAAMQASRADFTYPAGESRQAFRARVIAAARVELVGDVVAVLHKGVIKTILSALTGMSADEAHALPCDLGGISRLSCVGGRWTLEAVNETSHLEG